MLDGIGSTLREARDRRKVDLGEVAASTRIRPRYLQALENEEWDVLPGDPYTRGFVRTYASYLGLDGERLAEEYQRTVAATRAAPTAAQGSPRRGPKLSSRAWTAIVTVALIAALITIGLLGGGGDGVVTTGQTPKQPALGETGVASPAARKARPGVSVRLIANAEIWVCLLDASGRAVVDGQILDAGAQEGPFRSGSFLVSFGNGEVSMKIDGRQASIPATSGPIGYSIDSDGELQSLPGGKRPSCT